jgi:hypothetical protein
LTGVLKNILLVGASVLIWGTTIAPLQIFGYSIALVGFLLYKSSYEELKGVITGGLSWITNASTSRSFDEKRSSMVIKKAVFIIISLVIALALLYHFTSEDGIPHPWSAGETVTEADQLSQGWLSKLGYGR